MTSNNPNTFSNTRRMLTLHKYAVPMHNTKQDKDIAANTTTTEETIPMDVDNRDT